MSKREATQAEVDAFVDFIRKYRGERNALVSNQISYDPEETMFGIKNWSDNPSKKRMLRKVVNKARLQGHPIIGTTNGYFMAETEDEINHAFLRLTNSANELLEAADSLRSIKLKSYWE